MTNPKKFVVFSHGRAGTNFLMKNLAAHPDVKVHMEPFHNNESARAEVRGSTWQTGSSSKQFAYENIFNSQEKSVAAVGFKLFYFHCRQDQKSADIWPALLNDRDVHVIFLNRKNLLNKHLSDLRAQQSGVWHPRTDNYLDGQYKNVVDIRVKVPEAIRVMSDLYCGYHRISELFINHPNRHFFYEDLEIRGKDVLDQVFQFLEVRRIPVADPFRPGTLSRETTRIVNKKVLTERLQASVFSDFIQSCPLL